MPKMADSVIQVPTASSTTDLAQTDLRPLLLGVTWPLTILSILSLGARCYVGRTTLRGLRADDYVLIAAAGTLIAFAGTTTWGAVNQLCTSHSEAQNQTYAAEIDRLPLIVVVATTFSVLGAAWSKTSFAVTLLRATKGLLHCLTWCIIGSMNLILACNVLLQYIWCQPSSAIWTKGTKGACWDKEVIIYYSIAAGGYSAAMDIILTIIPWWVIKELKMQTREKVGVAVCMSLGIIAAVASVFRAFYTATIYDDEHAIDEGIFFICAVAELAVTIIAVSIAALHPRIPNMTRPNRSTWSVSCHNTFKSGTYMCSAVSRSRNYKRMKGGSGATTPTSVKGPSMVEDEESVTGLTSPDVVYERRKGHQGIMKTEEVTVKFDRNSRVGIKEKFQRHAILGFELDSISRASIVEQFKRGK